MDEVELARLCADGDEQAWKTLLDDYSAYINTSVTRTLARHGIHSGREMAEDIFSEVLLGLVEDRGRRLRAFEGRNGSRLSTYLWVLASRTAVDHLRKLSRRPRSDVSIDDSPYDPQDLRERPDQAFESSRERSLAEEIVRSLGEEDRRFVYYYYELELAPDEVAARLGVTTSAVYSRKNRIRAKFEKIYRKKTSRPASKQPGVPAVERSGSD